MFYCNTEVMSSFPSLSLNSTGNSIFYLNITHPSDHSHLCLLKSPAGQISLPCNILFCTQGKTNLDSLEQEIVSGNGIIWAICKSAPRRRQITTPASHHSVFTGWMPFLPPNQQRQSTEGNSLRTLQTIMPQNEI